MRKFNFYLLYPFKRLFDLFYQACSDYEDCLVKVDEHKVVYIVLGYYPNYEFDICAVCDDLDLTENFVNDLRNLDKYFKVSIVDFTLNQLNIV